MSDEPKLFTVHRVTDWHYVRSRVLGASSKPERDTPKALDLTCNKCRTRFIASESTSGRPGTFLPTLGGGMQITCGRCESEDSLSMADLPG